jgi:UV DNA damage endonuclease
MLAPAGAARRTRVAGGAVLSAHHEPGFRGRLGFAVKVLGEGGLPSHDTRRWQSGPHLRVSIERMHAVLDYLDRHDMRMYRMSSDFVPYGTHPELPQFHRQLVECADELGELGTRAKQLDIRLSFHPGQYCVLNSERPDVVAGAIRDLELHARVLDLMDQPPEAVVVLHVGARGQDPAAASDRFLAGFERLSERARERLVLENDDRLFGVGDVLRLSSRTGVRIVWDAHHHACHNPDRIPEREALQLALATWRHGVVPKLHYSSPRTALDERRIKRGRRVVRVPALPPRSAHADLVDPFAFDRFLRETVRGRRVDVMLEAKAKDLALLRLRAELASLRPGRELKAAA